MQTLIEARPKPTFRPWFISALVASFALFLALLAYAFARYPDARLSTSTGPKAIIPKWFGANGAGIAYLLLGGLISCLYIYVSIQGTPVRGVWRRGVVLGAGLGITWLVIGVCSILIETPALGLVLDAGLLIMPVLAGALGGRQTGRFGSGSLAGFWCGIAAAALIALSIVVIDIAFAPHLLQTNWSHDSHCDLHRGDALAACEISDDLGYAASILVILPVIMAGLGMIGGAIGTMTERRRVAKESPVVDSSRAPFIFSLLMVVLFATELLLNLW